MILMGVLEFLQGIVNPHHLDGKVQETQFIMMAEALQLHQSKKED